jgi:MFS family permease
LFTDHGLGAIIGNLSTAAISTPRAQGILYIIMAAASGLSLVILGLSHSVWLAFIVGLTVGASQAVFMAINLSFLLRYAKESYRGRVTSVNFMIASGAMAVGNFLYGALSRYVPPKISMVLGGSSFVLWVLFLLLISSAFRSLYAKVSPVNEDSVTKW